MWQELLKIKPVIDGPSGKKMEQSLTTRFSRVSKKFGGGLKSILKGAVLGISIGLLNRLLNPLQELETRIKALLGQGKDTKDLADRFGTSTGQLKDIEDFGSSLGVEPEKLKDLMSKFADAIDTARLEIANPDVPFSESTKGIQKFAGEQDIARSFLNFLATQKKESETDAGKKNSEAIQREIFGSVLYGTDKKLISTDFGAQVGKLGSSTGQQGVALEKLAGFSDQKSFLETVRARKELLAASSNLTSGTIAHMDKGEGGDQNLIDKRIASYQAMRDAADGINVIKNSMGKISDAATKGVGFLGRLLQKFPTTWGSSKTPGHEAKGKGKATD